MDPITELAKKVKWWGAAILSVGGVGFALAMTLGSLARASDVQKMDRRVTDMEMRSAVMEARREDDAKRIDWLVNEVEKLGWSMHTAPSPPPARKSMQVLDQNR